MDWINKIPISWEDFRKIKLKPSNLLLKFRKETKGLCIGLNLELHNVPVPPSKHAKLVLKPQKPDRKWKFICEPLKRDASILSHKIPISKFLNLQIGVGFNIQSRSFRWNYKLSPSLGGDVTSRIRNKISFGLLHRMNLGVGWRAQYVTPELSGDSADSKFSIKREIQASIDRVEVILTHAEKDANKKEVLN